MNANPVTDILSKIKAIAPNARGAKAMASRVSKRDTMDEARAKIVDKLKANRDYFTGATTDRPDPVYKEQLNGTYSIGVKCGNRYLHNIVGTQHYLEGIGAGEVAGVLDALVKHVEEGGCDDAIVELKKRPDEGRGATTH